MVAHSSLTGSDLHEPKGAAGASSGQVYTADGAGSGSWEAANVKNKVYLTYTIDDITTADSYFIPIPFACTLTSVEAVLSKGSGSLDSDTTITFEIATVATTGGVITLATSGAAEGNQHAGTAITSNNSLDGDTALEIVNDGAATVGGEVVVIVELTLT